MAILSESLLQKIATGSNQPIAVIVISKNDDLPLSGLKKMEGLAGIYTGTLSVDEIQKLATNESIDLIDWDGEASIL